MVSPHIQRPWATHLRSAASRSRMEGYASGARQRAVDPTFWCASYTATERRETRGSRAALLTRFFAYGAVKAAARNGAQRGEMVAGRGVRRLSAHRGRVR